MNAAKSMRVALAQRNMTQTNLAAKIGLTQAAISGLANRTNWNCESLVRVANGLNLKVSEFVALGED